MTGSSTDRAAIDIQVAADFASRISLWLTLALWAAAFGSWLSEGFGPHGKGRST